MKRSSLLPAAFLPAIAACGTTKGLNQIVTPDIQPLGQFSLSYQLQHEVIGNSNQVQMELGVSKGFEVAYFQGLNPRAGYFATEIGLIQKPTVQLATGFLGWSTLGDAPQPFLEGAYLNGKARYIAGMQRTGRANLPIAGVAYQTTPVLLLQADYLGSGQNFSTYGFTYSPNSSLSINPALYVSNNSAHKLYPYLVVSWTITAFK